jgi:hypothetical protein
MPLRRTAIALASASVFTPSGCVTFYSKTEVVGDVEPRAAVSFENGDAAQQFQTAVKRMDTHAGSTYLGVPFITVYQRDERYSEVALWNDAVRKCDTNKDGIITTDEVAAFNKALDH